jgi:uncharacterized protein (DUF58 family)
VIEDRFTPAEYSFKRIHCGDPLAPRTTTTLRYGVRCSKRRGRYEIGPIRISLSDPFGLFDQIRQVSVLDDFLVYPATVPCIHLVLAGESPRQIARSLSSRYTGDSPAFHGTREYRTGDEPRKIHWASSARRRKLVVVEHDREVANHLALFLDLDQKLRAGLGARSLLEYSVKLAASLTREAVGRRALVELICNDQPQTLIRSGCGRRQLLRILATLVEIKQNGEYPLAMLLARQLPRLPDRCQPVLITSSFAIDDPLLAELARHLRKRGTLLVLLLDHASFIQHHDLRPAGETLEAATALHRLGAHVILVPASGQLVDHVQGAWLPPVSMATTEHACA